MIHTCKICSKTSDEVGFYNRVTSRCKECHKKKVRENRKAKADYYREYDAHRYQSDPKVKARHKRYQETPRGKASMTLARKRWDSKNPIKRAASQMVNNAVRDGKLQKPSNCSECGAGGRIEGHHSDYNKPLDVDWLCPTCHTARHK